MTISLLTPFAAYIPAERLHVSGVLAVVASGLFLGWRGPQILTARTRLNIYVFWEMMVFLLNGLVFVLIGLQLPAHSSNALRPLFESARLARTLISFAAISCAHSLGFCIDEHAAFDEHYFAQGRIHSRVAEHGDCRLDRNARRGFARRCARGAADAF